MRNMQSTPYGDYRQWDYHYLLPGAPGTDMDGLWQGSASGTMHAAFRVLFSHCLDSFRKTGRKNSKLKKPLYIERTAWEPSDLSDPLKKKTLLSLFIYNHSSTYSSTYLLHKQVRRRALPYIYTHIWKISISPVCQRIISLVLYLTVREAVRWWNLWYEG